MRADVSKRGLMMGTKKVGTLSSRQKRASSIIAYFDIEFFNVEIIIESLLAFSDMNI